jgi:hypothetical protein
LTLLPLLFGCSESHPLTHEELQSRYRASISLASETAAFLGHLDQHAYSTKFTSGHLAYLEKQGSDIRHDLASASAQTPDLASLNELKTATAELTQTLDHLRSQPSNPAAYTSSIAALDSVRSRLEVDMPR